MSIPIGEHPPDTAVFLSDASQDAEAAQRGGSARATRGRRRAGREDSEAGQGWCALRADPLRQHPGADGGVFPIGVAAGGPAGAFDCETPVAFALRVEKLLGVAPVSSSPDQRRREVGSGSREISGPKRRSMPWTRFGVAQGAPARESQVSDRFGPGQNGSATTASHTLSAAGRAGPVCSSAFRRKDWTARIPPSGGTTSTSHFSGHGLARGSPHRSHHRDDAPRRRLACA